MDSPTTGLRAKARPQSLMAQNFSAALDDLFKLNGLGALEETVEQKKDTVRSQKDELQVLEYRLKDTTERLKKMENKYRRWSQQFNSSMMRSRPVVPVYEADIDETSSSSSPESSGREL